MDIRESLARNLKGYRRLRGLSQEELAHRAEIDRSYMSAIERGRYSASIDVLAKLAEALGLEVGDLFRTPPDSAPEAKSRKPKAAKPGADKKTGPSRNKT